MRSRARYALVTTATLLVLVSIAPAGESLAAGVGLIRSVAAQLLEELGITTNGVYTPGSVSANQDFDSVLFDQANKDVILERGSAGVLDINATSGGAGNGTFRAAKWEAPSCSINSTGANTLWLYKAGSAFAFMQYGEWRLASTVALGWTAGNAVGARDVWIQRNSAGRIDVNSSLNGGGNGQLAASGLVVAPTTLTAAATAGSKSILLCDATSAAFTVTLPAAASSSGLVYVLKKTDASANAVTIDGNAAETIDGSATYTLSTQYQTVRLVCDGTEWFTW